MDYIELKHKAEEARLTFIMHRDGLDEAIDFAKRVYRCYFLVLLSAKRKHLSSTATRNGHTMQVSAQSRRGFIESCLSFREFIRKYR